MDDKPCVVNVNGTDYYAPCDRLEYIVVVGTNLINTGSSSFNLYTSFPEQGNNSSGYPRIVMPTNTKAYLRTSQQQTTYQTVTVSSYDVISAHTESSSIFYLLILGVLMCLFLKR